MDKKMTLHPHDETKANEEEPVTSAQDNKNSDDTDTDLPTKMHLGGTTKPKDGNQEEPVAETPDKIEADDDSNPANEASDASPRMSPNVSSSSAETPSTGPMTAENTEAPEITDATGTTETADDGPAVRKLPDWRDRLPVILGITTVVCFVITVTSFGLQWMARHGGGTGDPVEASSEIDNTPIPMPHVSSVNMVNMSFPADMTLRIAMGEQSVSWDGANAVGDIPAEVTNTAGNTVAMALLVPEGSGELTIDFTSHAEQPFLSFNIAMGTKENGVLTMAGTINNLPNGGTARVSPDDYRVGVTNTDESATVFPVINITTSYTVGDENTDYVGSYVSSGASLMMGADTSEAYLTADTRNVTVTAPTSFGHGNILQASRTTIRQNGQQNSIMGTALMPEGDSEFSASYETLAENDESSKIMGRDVSLIQTDAGNVTEEQEPAEK